MVPLVLLFPVLLATSFLSMAKNPSMMNRDECAAFLQDHEVTVQKSWTLSEVRFLVKELMTEDQSQSDQPPKGMNNWRIAELKDKCQELGLTSSSKATRAELMLVIRDYYENTTSGETVMNFGRRKELTYQEVYTLFPDYVQWAKNEFTKNNGEGSGYLLRQFISWVLKNESQEKVDSQAPVTPALRSQNRQSETQELVAAASTNLLQQASIAAACGPATNMAEDPENKDIDQMTKEELLEYVKKMETLNNRLTREQRNFIGLQRTPLILDSLVRFS